MSRSRSKNRLAVLVVAAAAALAALAPHAAATGAQSNSQLQGTINSSKAREQLLAGQISRIRQLEARTAHAVAILQSRLTTAQNEFDRAQSREQHTLGRLSYQRRRAVRLNQRLRVTRRQLAVILRSEYENPPPDLVSVVFSSHGFADLLESIDFLHRVQRNDQQIVDLVHHARANARNQRDVLAKLEAQQRAAAASLRLRRNALAQIAAGLAARQAVLVQAHAAREAALQATRASRHKAETILAKLIAEQERAAVSHLGPGGPWAIPWSVVQCESGGQNLPPNWATASGYYQFIDSTWQRLGGSTPHAYQASKAEQDRLAARLWADGRGAGNWDCASIVGII
jgi:Transglycosylase-like domain